MMKMKNVCMGLSVFALALTLVFMMPQVVLATGSGKHAEGKAEIADPDVSEAMEQEVAEGAQDIRQGTREAAQETEQMAAEAAEETSEFVAETEQVIDRAAMSLKEVVNREKRIPKQVIQNAAGVAIFPDVTKAGFIAGGRYGRGLLMLNQKNNWNGPLFISLYGASVGAQLGVEQTDLFMVFNTQEAIRDLRDGDLTLGAQTSVAAGTWGTKTGATTDADVIVYKQTEGLFAGVSLSGAVINVDEDANRAFFKGQKEGRAYYGSEKVLSGEKQVPKTAKADKVIVILTDWD
jgi:lipid-binding SYLF domain-containing protein